MLIQILSHTPAYVWAILAFLVYRGVAAMREREVAPRQLTVIPIVMLLLSLQDIVARFGVGLLPLLTWVLPLRRSPSGTSGLPASWSAQQACASRAAPRHWR